MSNKRALDKEVFALEIARGATGAEAYKAAGGESTIPKTIDNAVWRLRGSPEVKQMIDDNIRDSVADGMIGITALTPKALNVMEEILSAPVTDKSVKTQAQVAARVLELVERYSPKSVDINLNKNENKVLSVDATLKQLLSLANDQPDIRDALEEFTGDQSRVIDVTPDQS